MMVAGNGEAVRSNLDIGVIGLLCSFSEDEGTKGGSGLRRLSLDSWLGTGSGKMARRRAKMVTRV
jgi:hypothetical protein